MARLGRNRQNIDQATESISPAEKVMQDLVLQLTSEQQAVLGVQNATRQPDVDKPARVKGAGFLQSVGVQIQPESLRDCWLQGCAPSAASTNSSGLGP